MKIYLVGGAVRDKLLKLPVKERDWVVVGAEPREMLQKGFRQVGKDFPVFLHPETHEEYALARIERKIKPGYQGFSFDVSPVVSLEEDLKRRDLTINAMAETLDGKLIDPYHGKKDLEQKILRHVSPAFVEDPVRILRVARFYARYAQLGFTIAPETYALMTQMVKSGEVNALVAERVFKELERGLAEANPEKFFECLAVSGALPILFPHLNSNSKGILALKAAVPLSAEALVRFAALLHHLPEDQSHIEPRDAILNICQRYRVPRSYQELALLTAQHYQAILNNQYQEAKDLLQLFYQTDIFRRETRFKNLLLVCLAIANAQQQKLDMDWYLTAMQLVKSVAVQALLDAGLTGQALAQKLKDLREKALANWLSNAKTRL